MSQTLDRDDRARSDDEPADRSTDGGPSGVDAGAGSTTDAGADSAAEERAGQTADAGGPRYPDHTVAVVVPAYNEATHIGDVLESIPPYVDRIYAVDDHSADDTWTEIRRRTPEGREPADPDDPQGRELEIETDSEHLGPVPEEFDLPDPDATDSTAAQDETDRAPAAQVATGSTTTGGDGTGSTGTARDSSASTRTSGTRATRTTGRSEDRTTEPASTSVTDGGAVVDDRIVPIRHPENRGAGAGIKTGYRHALADGVDVTVAMDGDGQMDPAHMPALVDPVLEGRAGYAKGNRLADGRFREEMPPVRQVGNWLLTMLTKVASGYWAVMDPQNGYTAIAHDALRAIDVDAIPAGHDYTNDLLVRLNVAGVAVADVDMPAVYGDETSTIDLRRFAPRTSLTLLSTFCWRLRRTYLAREFHPLVVGYGLGVASLAAGLGWGLTTLRREDAGAGVRAVFAVVTVLFGCAFVLAAMVLDRGATDAEVTRE